MLGCGRHFIRKSFNRWTWARAIICCYWQATATMYPIEIETPCGASEEQAEAFQAACGERFGAGAVLNPANLIDAKKVELKTEKVSLSIDPEYSHLVEAKVIDGQKVLIVPVEDHLEFNGVAVNVNKDKE